MQGIEEWGTHDVSVEILPNAWNREGAPIELHKPFLQPLKLTSIDYPRERAQRSYEMDTAPRGRHGKMNAQLDLFSMSSIN